MAAISVSAFAENRYTCTLEGKTSSEKFPQIAYMKYCRISGNKVIVKGQMGKVDPKTYNHVKRKTYKKKTSIKLAKNAKFYTASIEGRVRISKKKFANYVKAGGPIGLDFVFKGNKIVKMTLHA